MNINDLRLSFGLFSASCCFLLACFQNPITVTDIEFKSKEEASILLSSEDNYTRAWSEFDVQSRMGSVTGDKKTLLDFAGNQTLDWSSSEIKRIKKSFSNIFNQWEKHGFHANFPKNIAIIKSTGLEEGGAEAYTRENYIVLSTSSLHMKADAFQNLLTHELFHILSRHDEVFRKKMYKIIGFEIGEKLNFPEDLLRISNPDAHNLDAFGTFLVDGQPKELMMIIYSDRKYETGSFFEYLNIGFLELSDQTTFRKNAKTGETIIYQINQIDDFFTKVGENTEYLLDPEEILAENFSMTLNSSDELTSDWIRLQILDVLKK